MTAPNWRDQRWFQNEPYPCRCAVPDGVVRDRNGHHYDPSRKVVLGVQKCPEWRRWFLDCLESKRRSESLESEELSVVGIGE